MKTEKSYEIYIFGNEHFFTLDSEESIGYCIADLPQFLDWVSAYKCQKCNQIMILSGEAELVETEEREMGLEHFYAHENWFNCPQCKEELTIDVEFREYAGGWFFGEDNRGIEGISIDGLEWLAKEYYKSEKALREKEGLEVTLSMLQDRVKKNRIHYALIVEAKDDRAVWEQFLLRENVPLEYVDILFYGEGGQDEAIRLASLFRNKSLKRIPHKLVVDSDNKPESLIKKLKEKQIDPKDYHVLKEKEIESYLLEENAIAQIISIDIKELHRFNEKLDGALGRERLEKIFIHYTGHAPKDQTKGLIVRALKETPEEIRSIAEEIQCSLAANEEYC